MSKTVTVGIADLNVVKAPDILVTFALGSCVGICLYDAKVKVAGLSHIMLPSSAQMQNVASSQHMKFADTGVAMLVQKMERAGASKTRMTAKIAGGAQMFAAMSTAAIANIGERNIQAVKATLNQLRIPIVAEDCGKNYGRTQYFSASDGVMLIKSVTRGQWTY